MGSITGLHLPPKALRRHESIEDSLTSLTLLRHNFSHGDTETRSITMLTSPNTPNGRHSELGIRNSLFEAVRRRRSLDARRLRLARPCAGGAQHRITAGADAVETRG